MRRLFGLFTKIIGRINRGEPLPRSALRWAREPFKREELNRFCEITADMSEEEAARRIRATYYPGAPGPYIKIAGHRFDFSGKVT